MGPKSQTRARSVVPAVLFLLALVPTFSEAAPECSVEYDTVDTDGDRLSDCLERVSLGTQPGLPDSDGDGLLDSRDLLVGAATEFTLTATVVELVDLNGLCDTGWYKTKAHRWWDPYVSHAYLAINTVNGGQDAAFLNANMKKGDWVDERHINPVDLSAALVLPTDVHAYLNLDPGVPPLMTFRFGLLDYDPESKDENIRLRVGGDIVGDVPISLGYQGSKALLHWEDKSEGCAGRLVLAIDTPIQWDTAVAAVFAKTQSLVTFDQIREARLQNPYASRAASTPLPELGVHDAAEVAAETVLLRALGVPEVVVQKAIDINSLPDTRHPEHPLNRLYDRDLYGKPLKDATGNLVENHAELLLCVPDAENLEVREECAIPTQDDLPPTGIDPGLIQQWIEECGLYEQAQGPVAFDCRGVIETALEIPEVAVAAIRQALEDCGLSTARLGTQQDGVDCQALLDAVDDVPGAAAAILQALVRECGLSANQGASACQQVLALVDKTSKDLARTITETLEDCQSKAAFQTTSRPSPCGTAIDEADAALDLALALAKQVVESCGNPTLSTKADLAACETIFTLVEALPGVVLRVVGDLLQDCPKPKGLQLPRLECQDLLQTQAALHQSMGVLAVHDALAACDAQDLPSACFAALESTASFSQVKVTETCNQVNPSLLRQAGSPLQGRPVEGLAVLVNQTGAVVAASAVRLGADEVGSASLASWAPLQWCEEGSEIHLIAATSEQNFVGKAPLPKTKTQPGRGSEAILSVADDGSTTLTEGWLDLQAVDGLLDLVGNV